jgi:GNAT superfamily N-acetyltransferase
MPERDKGGSRARHGDHPALPEYQEIQLTNFARGVASQAEELFHAVSRYEEMVALEGTIEKRIRIASELVLSTSEYADRASPARNTESEQSFDAQRVLDDKMHFFNELQDGLRSDSQRLPGYLAERRRSILRQVGFIRSQLERFCSSENFGEIAVQLPRDDTRRSLGVVRSAADEIVSHTEEFASDQIAAVALALMKLTHTLETRYMLSWGREAAQSDANDCERVCKSRLGWRLGLPQSRAALVVSSHHLRGRERDQAEEFIDPSARQENTTEGWLTFSFDAEQSAFEDELKWRGTESYGGILATRRVCRPASQQVEDICVGAILYHQLGSVFEVNAIKVADDVQGRGVGTQMMTEFLKSVLGTRRDARIFIDIPYDERDGYHYDGMFRFLNSLGFTATASGVSRYRRMTLERGFSAPLLGL